MDRSRDGDCDDRIHYSLIFSFTAFNQMYLAQEFKFWMIAMKKSWVLGRILLLKLRSGKNPEIVRLLIWKTLSTMYIMKLYQELRYAIYHWATVSSYAKYSYVYIYFYVWGLRLNSESKWFNLVSWHKQSTSLNDSGFQILKSIHFSYRWVIPTGHRFTEIANLMDCNQNIFQFSLLLIKKSLHRAWEMYWLVRTSKNV